jgi:hypothetical protein
MVSWISSDNNRAREVLVVRMRLGLYLNRAQDRPFDLVDKALPCAALRQANLTLHLRHSLVGYLQNVGIKSLWS